MLALFCRFFRISPWVSFLMFDTLTSFALATNFALTGKDSHLLELHHEGNTPLWIVPGDVVSVAFAQDGNGDWWPTGAMKPYTPGLRPFAHRGRACGHTVRHRQHHAALELCGIHHHGTRLPILPWTLQRRYPLAYQLRHHPPTRGWQHTHVYTLYTRV